VGTAGVGAVFEAHGESVGGGLQTNYTNVVDQNGDYCGFLTITLNGWVVLEEPRTVNVVCTATETTWVSTQPSNIIALEASSIINNQDSSPHL